MRKVKRPFFLREWRIHRALTQQQLADRAGFSKPFISELERSVKPYTQSTLEALADALSVDPADLIMRDPTSPEAIWSVWDNVPPSKRDQALRVLAAFAEEATKKAG